MLKALQNGTEAQRQELLSYLGKSDITAEEIQRSVQLLQELGGIDYVRNLAEKHIQDALQALENLSQTNPHVELLRDWACYLIHRKI